MRIESQEHESGQPVVKWKGPRNINKHGLLFQEEPRKGGSNMTEEEIEALRISMFGETSENPKEKGGRRRHKTHRPHSI